MPAPRQDDEGPPVTETAPHWFSDLLVCLECDGGSLTESGDALTCTACHAQYPICHTVPLLMPKRSFVDAAQVIGQHLGGISAEDVESVFGTALRYRLKDRTLRGEFTNIVDRYTDVLPDHAEEASSSSNDPCALVAEYFNNRFVSGKSCYRSFRIRNTSNTTWTSTGVKPWNLSYFLYDLDEPATVIEGCRSALPIPLRPFHEVTVPLRIATPVKLGRYKIVVKLVQEFVGWFEQPLYEGEIEVVADPEHRPNLVNNPHRGFFDFGEDLEQCGKTLRRAVALLREAGAGDEHYVLEVACGNDPQTLRHYQEGTRVVACDVAFPQVQFGALQYAADASARIRPDAYRFMAADVYNPPYRPGTFDLVVISAALHHFVDVTDALRRLARLLKPTGFLVLMREPCKVFPEDEMFLQELRNGFNEQQFELEEYDEMFRRARLERVYEQIDYECSYKTILRSLGGADIHA